MSYAAFRTAQASRTPMIYVGANDGFLHGFRAADGEEKLAYMPSAVYSEISKLTGQSYAHRFYVDASPNVDDAKIGGSWRTVLVSGLGAGGRGVFALDVTNPGLFASEANADNISLWEFNSSNDADLGNTYGIPAIVKLNDGNWGAIFGNGYNATGSGKSGIFVVNLATGAVIRKIMTGVGSGPNPNGIGAITAADLDGNGSADVVYGGDLTGRLWKFDLSDPLSANWGVAFSGSPLFHAVSGGNNQAITSAPEISLHPISGVIVTFGTGRYIATDDPTTTQTQSIYGVRDNGSGDLDRGDLVQQTVTSIFTSSGTQFRTMSNNAINWSSKDGWYLDLPDAGERVAVDPVLRAGRAVFTTLVPSSNPCSAGGTGWLMEVNYSTGGQLTDKPFDTNKDGVVDGSDQSAAGEALSAISSSPAVQSGYGTSASPLENKYLNQSSGNIARVLESGSRLANRRMSWRQQQ